MKEYTKSLVEQARDLEARRFSTKILMPVDQSRRDSIALPYAARMAPALGARIALVQVVPLTRSIIPNAMRHAKAYLDAVEAGLREQGLAVETAVRRGDPATVIIALADELKADLILMTTRGRSGLGKFVLGSVADAVLANCPKPVLLLSEHTNGVAANEENRIEAAYLATFVWNKKARGLCTQEEAERELERLVMMGLDRTVLFSIYHAQEDRGVPYAWLDIDFQVKALRKFFPEDAAASEDEEADQVRPAATIPSLTRR